MSLVIMLEVILRKKAWKRSQNRHLTTAKPYAALTLVCPIVISTSARKECKSVGASSWRLKTIPPCLCVGSFVKESDSSGSPNSEFHPPSLWHPAVLSSHWRPLPVRPGMAMVRECSFIPPYVYIDLHRVATYVV